MYVSDCVHKALFVFGNTRIKFCLMFIRCVHEALIVIWQYAY